MSKKDEEIERIKRVGDLAHESSLLATILSYARSGHATALMIEQSVAMVDKHIAYAKETGDDGMLSLSVRLKKGLEQALIDGIQSLRSARGLGPEIIQVEEPIARSRIALGHRIRRQMRCANGIVDIYDLTADELIECKLVGTSGALGEAVGQLQRYRKSFPGASLSIAVLSIATEARWLADLLRNQGIKIIEVPRDVS